MSARVSSLAPAMLWRNMVTVCAVLLCVSAAVAASTTPVTVDLKQSSPDQMLLSFQLQDYQQIGVNVDGQKFTALRIAHEPVMLMAGAPALPHVARSVIVPDQGAVTLTIVPELCRYEEYTGIDLAPSKGNLSRQVDPATVPYSFGPEYRTNAFFPGSIAGLGTPYILRDFRGATVDFYPFQYNPVKRTLRVYTKIAVQVETLGGKGINELDPASRSGKIAHGYHYIYGRQFLNYDPDAYRYDPLDEDGDMLIICYDSWLSQAQPLADHKNSFGIPTTLVGVSTIGNDATSIKNYIQDLYNTSDLAYVLLIGDGAQVASPTSDADPTYGQLAGSDDYPEAMIGRFSAETADQVVTQVERTITYETMPAPTTEWFWKGVGIASEQGGGSQGDEGQSDQEHMEEIRQWLLAYGYTQVDELYGADGATAAQVAAAVNEGRGIINYCGHGSVTSWSTTGFSNSDVNALVNNNMLPFIVSVACSNGDFNGTTCFAEAWLRATNGGEPTGAIAVYASTISQSWTPPMEGQDEFNIQYVGEGYISYGALCFAGSCSMMDDYGTDGVDEFEHWTVFGDPSLRVRITCTDAGTIRLDSTKYACNDLGSVSVVDCGLNLDDLAEDTVTINIASDTDPTGIDVLCTEIGPATGQFEGSFETTDGTPGAGMLATSEGDTVTATYIDADDGAGNYDVVVTSEAVVDCTPPTISNVQAIDVQPRDAVIQFDTDELAQGAVSFGLSCDELNQRADGAGYSMTPTVALTGLQDNTTYYYMVEAVDEAGNVCTDPQCYMFTTPEVPDFFTELFETDFDLAGLSLMFVPGNPTDFYTGCVVGEITSLPTDPAGGTTVSLGDDASTEVSITGGNTVSLYGVSYSSFYICSNGYITFGTSDTTYSETLEDHFSLPRIAGIFDDFNPSSGGTVSYEQLADRMVVTWDGIPEYSESNSNTFQVEMYFDGTIVLSYLDVAVVDGLVGLSEGEGLDPDYFESDLSNMPSCGPRPPYAAGDEVLTDVNEPVDIELLASDDGLPDPPAALTYTIVSLPEHGDLSDPDGGVIDAVPYTLIAGNMVNYAPDYAYTGPDAFTFMVNDGGTPPDGGDSNVATISITVGGPQPVHVFMLDEDPGWSVEGDWAFGVPTGGGSHNYDPTSGYTGDNVYGYNLAGDYENEIPEYALTTTAIDCSDMTGVELRFWRWLGVESATWDHANVQVSNDGTTWTMVWEHTDSSISDTSWSQQVFDISGVADNAATVYVRWVMGETDTSVTYPGWNIDDIELWGVVPFEVATGDLNCDGYVNFDDINPFVTAMVGQAEYEAEYPDCNWLNGDTDANGTVNFDDIDGFVELLAGK